MRMTFLASMLFMALGTAQPALAQASDEAIENALNTTLDGMGHPWTAEEMTLRVDPTQTGENNSRMMFEYEATVVLDEMLYKVHDATDENLFISPTKMKGSKTSIEGYGDARFVNDTWVITVDLFDRSPVQKGNPKSYFVENHPNQTIHDMFTPEGATAYTTHKRAKEDEEAEAQNAARNEDAARTALSEQLAEPWTGLAQCGPYTQVPLTMTFPTIEDETYFVPTLTLTLGDEIREATYHADHQDGRIRGRFDAWISENKRGRFGDFDMTLSATTLQGTLGDCTFTLMAQSEMEKAQTPFTQDLTKDLATLTGVVKGSQMGPSDREWEMEGSFTTTQTGLTGTLSLPIFDANSRAMLGVASVPFSLDFSLAQKVPLFSVGTVDTTQFPNSALNAFSVKGGCDRGTTIAWNAETKTLTLESGTHSGACFDTAQFTFQ